jgi:hypothetical protein
LSFLLPSPVELIPATHEHDNHEQDHAVLSYAQISTHVGVPTRACSGTLSRDAFHLPGRLRQSSTSFVLLQNDSLCYY